MTTTVEIEVVEGFILDDPVAGVLDNVQYTLSGEAYEDISNSMIGVETARGKNYDLDRYSAGQARIILNNETRKFDPNYSAGPLFGQIVPRRRLRIAKDGVRVFTGIIDDWNFDYAPSNTSRAEIVASDELTFLARSTTTAGTATPQLTGARVNAILDQSSVNWPTGQRNIDVGESSLGADIIEGGNALDYLKTVAESEQGALFIAKNGDLQFRSRLDFTPTSGAVTEFADDGTGIPYSRVNVEYGAELLLNTVTVETPVGNVSSVNQRSRTSYGVVSDTFTTLLSDIDEAQRIADWIVAKYAEPEFRFSGIELSLDKMTSGERSQVLGLELGSVIKVKFTPNGIGDPIEQYGQVIRLDHEIGRTTHDMVIGVAQIARTFLVLNDSVFGTMDTTNVLAP